MTITSRSFCGMTWKYKKYLGKIPWLLKGKIFLKTVKIQNFYSKTLRKLSVLLNFEFSFSKKISIRFHI
jgi:hypothetical protein